MEKKQGLHDDVMSHWGKRSVSIQQAMETYNKVNR